MRKIFISYRRGAPRIRRAVLPHVVPNSVSFAKMEAAQFKMGSVKLFCGNAEIEKSEEQHIAWGAHELRRMGVPRTDGYFAGAIELRRSKLSTDLTKAPTTSDSK